MHAAEGAVQPAKFGDIPTAMWWAIATLTTVGYGDAVPITPIGRIVAGFTMIVGLGLFALPVGFGRGRPGLTTARTDPPRYLVKICDMTPAELKANLGSLVPPTLPVRVLVSK